MAPLTLDMTQSTGTSSCIGAYGHSLHMAQVGFISHDQFPQDICGYGHTVFNGAENVGMDSSGDELHELHVIHDLMMTEPYSPGCSGNHVCNILSPYYTSVGIGIYYSGNTTWLTEDFIG